MKIVLYHGYELSGSGSNEYTRRLAIALKSLGHQVILVCGEETPEAHGFVDRCYSLENPQRVLLRFSRPAEKNNGITLYQLPRASILPVYVADKQRPGGSKLFIDLTDRELDEYHSKTLDGVRAALKAERPDVVHANHLVWQPVIAAEACASFQIPFYIVPHGSSLEYVVRRDERYLRAAEKALLRASGVIWIAASLQRRVLELYPKRREAIQKVSSFVGTGVDASVFQPVERSKRTQSFRRLLANERSGGKRGDQKNELRRRLRRRDIEAARDYWDAYDHTAPDLDLAEQLNAIAPGDDLLLYVGALTWGKGVQALLAAMPEIIFRRPNARLLVVGSGTFREALEALAYSIETGDETLFDELVAAGRGLDRGAAPGPLDEVRSYAGNAERQRMLSEHGARTAGRIHFLGHLGHPQLRWLFPCCQLAIFPSIIDEASPLVFAESLASGVPAAVAYHSGLKDGLDALLQEVPPEVFKHLQLDPQMSGRVASIADNVSWLLAQGVSNALRATLRRIAEERHNWEAVAKGVSATARKSIEFSRLTRAAEQLHAPRGA